MITRNRILFALGLWIVFVPLFSGFPSSYESFFIVVSGLGVITLAFMYARDRRLNTHYSSHSSHDSKQNDRHEVYAESYPRETRAVGDTQETDDDDDQFTDIEEIRNRSRGVRTY
jgi:hypothetical protein